MKPGYSDRLSTFAADTRLEDIPHEVVEYAKLVLLDCIICGIAAGGFERSRMLAGIYTDMGGKPEAPAFGLDHRLPAPHAAAANTEAMNLLDADDTFFTASHFAAFPAAACLAEAARTPCSGSDLLKAFILGYDITARIFLAQVSIVRGDDGRFQYSPVQGMGFAAFGSAISSALIRGMPGKDIRRLLGVTGWLAPTPTCNPMAEKTEHNSFKYANYGSAALAGMMAVHYTEAGYVGQADILDSGGFIRAQGCSEADLELLTLDLGKKWWIEDSCIKHYPSCRYTSAPIDMLLALMKEQNLSHGDIESIDIEMSPVAYAMTMFREPATSIASDHRAPLNGAFNIPYVMALAAMGHTPGPLWYQEEQLRNPAIWDFASRVTTSENSAAIADMVKALTESRIRRFRRNPASMTVRARGKTHRLNADYAMGDPWTAKTRADWNALSAKLQNFCEEILGADRCREIIDAIASLEQHDQVPDLF